MPLALGRYLAIGEVACLMDASCQSRRSAISTYHRCPGRAALSRLPIGQFGSNLLSARLGLQGASRCLMRAGAVCGDGLLAIGGTHGSEGTGVPPGGRMAGRCGWLAG